MSIFPSKFRDWQIVHGDVRKNPEIAADMLAFMRVHGVKSVAMSDGLMACPHQEGIDYEGEWSIRGAPSGTGVIDLPIISCNDRASNRRSAGRKRRLTRLKELLIAKSLGAS